jgi:hypothetical protein
MRPCEPASLERRRLRGGRDSKRRRDGERRLGSGRDGERRLGSGRDGERRLRWDTRRSGTTTRDAVDDRAGRTVRLAGRAEDLLIGDSTDRARSPDHSG